MSNDKEVRKGTQAHPVPWAPVARGGRRGGPAAAALSPATSRTRGAALVALRSPRKVVVVARGAVPVAVSARGGLRRAASASAVAAPGKAASSISGTRVPAAAAGIPTAIAPVRSGGSPVRSSVRRIHPCTLWFHFPSASPKEGSHGELCWQGVETPPSLPSAQATRFYPPGLLFSRSAHSGICVVVVAREDPFVPNGHLGWCRSTASNKDPAMASRASFTNRVPDNRASHPGTRGPLLYASLWGDPCSSFGCNRTSPRTRTTRRAHAARSGAKRAARGGTRRPRLGGHALGASRHPPCAGALSKSTLSARVRTHFERRRRAGGVVAAIARPPRLIVIGH